MLESLEATHAFLANLIGVPLTDFEVLPGGFHCQALAFRAQEHALVLKISRNDSALWAEQSIREHFGAHPPVPIPAVFFKGHHQGWAWIVQARCAGQALSQQATLPRLALAAQALLSLHQWRGAVSSLTFQGWRDFLCQVHGFLPAELRPHSSCHPLTPAVWCHYLEQLRAFSSVYEDLDATVWCWIHGDLKPDHLFVHTGLQQAGSETAVSGLIDWELFRYGDFVYDWAVFMLYSAEAKAILRCFVETYGGQGFNLKHLNARLKSGALHSALGALFMWSQTQQVERYHDLKLRLDTLLKIDFERLL